MINVIQQAKLCSVAAALAVILAGCGNNQLAGDAASTVTAEALQERLDALQETRDDVPGFAVALVLDDGTAVSAASGEADPDGRAMTPETPVRMASITKTFVAAAVLRLREQGLLDIDAPVSGLISADHNALLLSDGYDTDAVTVRHLLMHAGGLNDHFADNAYAGMVMSDPARVWTRTDQIRVMVEATDPVGAPGEAFFYSDTGFVLLGEIIETVTGEPLGQAVRKLTKLDAIGLNGIWWDEEDAPPVGIPDRAHQWLGGVDTYPINGTMDAYGGGGIIASVEDIARFFAALFGGEVFDNPKSLSLMTEAPGHPADSPYRMGLFIGETEGYRTFGHGGFWGSDALAVPDLKITMAGVALDQSGVDDLRAFHAEIVGSVTGDSANE
jgi:D-alanyl-D-alanine carboxypeptidase